MVMIFTLLNCNNVTANTTANDDDLDNGVLLPVPLKMLPLLRLRLLHTAIKNNNVT